MQWQRPTFSELPENSMAAALAYKIAEVSLNQVIKFKVSELENFFQLQSATNVNQLLPWKLSLPPTDRDQTCFKICRYVHLTLNSCVGGTLILIHHILWSEHERRHNKQNITLVRVSDWGFFRSITIPNHVQHLKHMLHRVFCKKTVCYFNMLNLRN